MSEKIYAAIDELRAAEIPTIDELPHIDKWLCALAKISNTADEYLSRLQKAEGAKTPIARCYIRERLAELPKSKTLQNGDV